MDENHRQLLILWGCHAIMKLCWAVALAGVVVGGVTVSPVATATFNSHCLTAAGQSVECVNAWDNGGFISCTTATTARVCSYSINWDCVLYTVAVPDTMSCTRYSPDAATVVVSCTPPTGGIGGCKASWSATTNEVLSFSPGTCSAGTHSSGSVVARAGSAALTGVVTTAMGDTISFPAC